MKSTWLIAAALAAFPMFVSPSDCQASDGVYWHIDPNVKTCSMMIDPSLTQDQWETFTRQAGALGSFKSLAPAETMGKLNYILGVDYSITPVDQHDAAWINTFTHPDADCPLGDQVYIPTIRGRLGVSRTMDVGGFWTTAPGANYGFVGGEFKYLFLNESERMPAAAVRASGTWLTGVPDFNLSIYSVDLVASKRVEMITPYLGVREVLSIGQETTDKVDLDTERVLLTQGFVGAAYSIWKFGLAAEFDVAEVNTFSFVVGFSPRAGSATPSTEDER